MTEETRSSLSRVIADEYPDDPQGQAQYKRDMTVLANAYVDEHSMSLPVCDEEYAAYAVADGVGFYETIILHW